MSHKIVFGLGNYENVTLHFIVLYRNTTNTVWNLSNYFNMYLASHYISIYKWKNLNVTNVQVLVIVSVVF